VSRPPASAKHDLRWRAGRRALPHHGQYWGLGLLAPSILIDVHVDASYRDPDASRDVAPASKVIDVAAVLRSQSSPARTAQTVSMDDSAYVANHPALIERVAWLEGCWEASSPQRTTEERWTAPRAGSMLGTSRTTRNETLLEHEFITLREVDGALAYQARPSGQPAAEFRSTRITDSAVVFENPQHDFPQLIGYRRGAADSLHAWIEGSGRSGPRRVNFAYRRVTCEP
jgi:hypothetical protein